MVALLGFLPIDVSQKIVSTLDTMEKEILIKEITTMRVFEKEELKAVLIDFLHVVKGAEDEPGGFLTKLGEQQIAKQVENAVKEQPEKTTEYIKNLIQKG